MLRCNETNEVARTFVLPGLYDLEFSLGANPRRMSTLSLILLELAAFLGAAVATGVLRRLLAAGQIL